MKHFEFVDEVLNNISALVSHKVPYEHIHSSLSDVKVYTTVFHNRKYFLYYDFVQNIFKVTDYNNKLKTYDQSIKIGLWDSESYYVEWENRDNVSTKRNDNSCRIPKNINNKDFYFIDIKKRHVTYSQFLKFPYIKAEFERKKKHRNNILYRIGFSIRMLVRI